MTGHESYRRSANRALGLVVMSCLLAGWWACIPAIRTAPEPPPTPPAEGTVPPAEVPPETKPQAEPAAQVGPEDLKTDADLDLVMELTVPSVHNWTDAGLEVQTGEEFVIRASGGISLQRGNPMAFCGPDGYDLRTAQQPLPDRNIGALVGRVVKLISVQTDPETKKTVRNELIEMFYVGTESKVLIPIQGRLQLGINENVAGDNSGSFKALIFRPKKFLD